jgi:hypothetical protein
VCTSAFVTEPWLEYMEQSYNSITISIEDFRILSSFMFQAINSLCTLVNDTIVNSLTRFYDTSYVSSAATPADVFQSQTKSFVSQFQSSTIKDFLLSLRMMQDTTEVNGLLSSSQTNGIINLKNDDDYRVTIDEAWYGDCNCNTKSTCTQSCTITDLLTAKALLVVPGLYNGCFNLEGVLRSNLQCFYNETCLQNVATALDLMLPPEITVMNASASSRYLSNANVGELLSNLMVEDWSWSGVYADYYKQCEPSECSYTLQSRNDLIYIITTLIGLIGGLTTALYVLIPMLVELVRKKRAPTNSIPGKVLSK